MPPNIWTLGKMFCRCLNEEARRFETYSTGISVRTETSVWSFRTVIANGHQTRDRCYG